MRYMGGLKKLGNSVDRVAHVTNVGTALLTLAPALIDFRDISDEQNFRKVVIITTFFQKMI